MKKFIALLLLGAFVATVAIGCGDKEKKNGEKPTEKKGENGGDNGGD